MVKRIGLLLAAAAGAIGAGFFLLDRRVQVPLEGKVVLISGGESGLGGAAARAFAEAGARPILADGLDGAASDAEALSALTEDVRRRHGRIDVLVSATETALGGLFQDGDPARLRAMVETDLIGTIHLVRAVAPIMIAQGSGHIVIAAGLAGRLPAPGYAAWTAVRAGLVGFADAFRREVDDAGLRVSLVLTGADGLPLPADGFAAADADTIAAALAIREAVYAGRREVVAGGLSSRALVLLNRLAPPLADLYWRWRLTPEFLHRAAERARQQARYTAEF